MFFSNIPRLFSVKGGSVSVSDLSAGFGADEASDGAVVVVVRPDEDPEQRRLSSAPVHGFRLTQLQLHWSLTPGVSL